MQIVTLFDYIVHQTYVRFHLFYDISISWFVNPPAIQPLLHQLESHSLRRCHNGRDSVSNHQPRHCLLSLLFRHRSKKASKLRVTGLYMGNSPGTRKMFPFDDVIMATKRALLSNREPGLTQKWFCMLFSHSSVVIILSMIFDNTFLWRSIWWLILAGSVQTKINTFQCFTKFDVITWHKLSEFVTKALSSLQGQLSSMQPSGKYLYYNCGDATPMGGRLSTESHTPIG